MTPARRVILLAIAEVVRRHRAIVERAEQRFANIPDSATAGELREAGDDLRIAAGDMGDWLDAFDTVRRMPDYDTSETA